MGWVRHELKAVRDEWISPQVFEALFSDLVGQDGFSIGVVDVLPNSRGVVRLKSRDPTDVPLIDPQYFEDPADIKRLLKGIRAAQRIGAMASLRGFGSKPVIRQHPSCSDFPFNSDAYWECYIRHNARPASNFGGTCRMGSPSTNSTVVDTSLRLLGLQGIRVVDASIMPTPVSASPMAATVMIAEKAAVMMTQPSNAKSDH
ncbi:hypothetical protein CAPTEDRAFT_89808 [Capitella teleta]|uniref:Glucose-methanol-choline oxidoreductase C-terminal domain-containing protein n=1 Tax=Capitella teleta TaxID=283909 RepID=R7TMV2_CAPTE|nr:hypothetical protein CAPTEDRAFT_89808 [Capitella teleta]|eukprot:ELT95203.1 hypothetical protein CAPTEDRAFT_89808 [Capitella teleta]